MPAAILNGVCEILDNWLGLTGRIDYGTRPNIPKYCSKQAGIDLSRNGGPLANAARTVRSPSDMINQTMACLETNLRDLPPKPPASSNWMWEKSYHLASHNESEEKQLEKYAVFLLDDRWANQIPVCNGLGQGASACRLDLAFRASSREYELIELKFGQDDNSSGSDHPLYAAMEILSYGLLYLLFRKHNLLGKSLTKKHHLLQAEVVHLTVLAPDNWYRFRTGDGVTKNYAFEWLERSITDGLRDYLATQKMSTLEMDFRFSTLPQDLIGVYKPLTTAIAQFRANNLGPRNPVYNR